MLTTVATNVRREADFGALSRTFSSAQGNFLNNIHPSQTQSFGTQSGTGWITKSYNEMQKQQTSKPDFQIKSMSTLTKPVISQAPSSQATVQDTKVGLSDAVPPQTGSFEYNPNANRTLIEYNQTRHQTRIYDARTGEKKRFFSTMSQGPGNSQKAEQGERSYVTYGGMWSEKCNPLPSEQTTQQRSYGIFPFTENGQSEKAKQFFAKLEQQKALNKQDTEPLWLDPKTFFSANQTNDSSKTQQKIQTRGYHTSTKLFNIKSLEDETTNNQFKMIDNFQEQ